MGIGPAVAELAHERIQATDTPSRIQFTNLDPTAPSFGPGDATFAYQWVVNINPGDAFLMSKDKVLAVPEPVSGIAFAGLAAIAVFRRRKKA